MRFDYDEQNFVEYADKWTRREVRSAGVLGGEEYLELLRSKITSLRLECEDGVIDQPDQLTDEAIDGLDMVLWQWFTTTPVAAINKLADLGNAKRRLLLGIAEPETTAAEPPQKN